MKDPGTTIVFGMELKPITLAQIVIEGGTSLAFGLVFSAFMTLSPGAVVATFYAGCLRQCGGKAFSPAGIILIVGLTVITSFLWVVLIGPDFFGVNQSPTPTPSHASSAIGIEDL